MTRGDAFPPKGAIEPAPVPTPFRLVATDLDGTLLRDDLTVSRRTRRALALAHRAGAQHIVVTGRPASGCRPILEAIVYQGVAVCGQGAQLYDAGAHRLLATAVLDRETARSAVARITVAVGPVALAVLTAGLAGKFVLGPGYARPGEFPSCAVVPEAELWGELIEKVFLRYPVLDDHALVSATAALCGPGVTVTHSRQGEVELLPAGVDKAVGLARATDLLGLSSADTVAFGDMPNDIEMLRWARHGVAVGNAHPDVLTVADEVAPTNANDGVAAVLERLFGRRPTNRS